MIFPPPPPRPEWATYIPGRRTKADFSIHTHLGHAKNAVTGSGYGQVYQWSGTEWVLVWDIKPGDDIPWRKSK